MIRLALVSHGWISLTVGLIVGLAATIKPAETLSFPAARLRSTFVQGAIRGMRNGAIFAGIFGGIAGASIPVSFEFAKTHTLRGLLGVIAAGTTVAATI
jgi:hypothetical protein